MTALPHSLPAPEYAAYTRLLRQLDSLSCLPHRSIKEQLRASLIGLGGDQQSAQHHVEQTVEEIQNACLPDFAHPTALMLGMEAKAPKKLCHALLQACHYLTWRSPQRPTAAYLAALGLSSSAQAYREHGCDRLFRIAFSNPAIRESFYNHIVPADSHRLLDRAVSDLICLQNDGWNGYC